MTEKEYLLRIREYLHDPEGKIWNDDELTKMLVQSAKTYSKDTGIFRGRFSIMVNSEGSFRLPKDFVAFVAGWNPNGKHINAIPVTEVSRYYGDFSSVEGDAEFCYEDFEDIGKARLCPNPYAKQDVKNYQPDSFGLIPLSGYGIPLHGQEYGLPTVIYKFNSCGDAVYIRTEEFERIPDYIALIYHVVYQAYTIDSDFQNTNKADLYYSQYKRRIAHFGQIKAMVSSVKNGGRYY